MELTRAGGLWPLTEFLAEIGAPVNRLLRTAMPVGEVAAALGYTDPANFSRAVRHTTGVAPTVHRAGPS